MYETLDALVRRERRWLPAMLDWVAYTPNPAIQAEALRLAVVLSERLPQLPDLLLRPSFPGLLPTGHLVPCLLGTLPHSGADSPSQFQLMPLLRCSFAQKAGKERVCGSRMTNDINCLSIAPSGRGQNALHLVLGHHSVLGHVEAM